MKAGGITAVQIIHDDLQGKEYYFVSEFLRLIGIHVYGYDEIGDCESYQKVLVIKSKLSEDICRAVDNKKNEYDSDFIWDIDVLDAGKEQEYLEKCLSHIFDKDFSKNNDNSDDCDLRTLKMLAKIYVQYDYLSIKKKNRLVYGKSSYHLSGTTGNYRDLLRIGKRDTEYNRESRYIKLFFLC